MTARSFRLVFGLVLKLFALETDYSRVVSLLREPKTLSCARVWLKKKTKCYALCFLHGSGASEESPGAVKRYGLARARRECCRFATQHACA